MGAREVQSLGVRQLTGQVIDQSRWHDVVFGGAQIVTACATEPTSNGQGSTTAM